MAVTATLRRLMEHPERHFKRELQEHVRNLEQVIDADNVRR
jgi:hypothetical protein